VELDDAILGSDGAGLGQFSLNPNGNDLKMLAQLRKGVF
jgi:hypothetical protein